VIEKGIILGVDAGIKIIKIPIFLGGKLIWKGIKVPAKFIWCMAKIPIEVIIRLAWRLAKKPLKLITPVYLQNTLKQLVDDYKMKKNMKHKQKSRFHRMKVSIKNKISRFEKKHMERKNKYKNRNHAVTN
jgi:hypothetical protein